MGPIIKNQKTYQVNSLFSHFVLVHQLCVCHFSLLLSLPFSQRLFLPFFFLFVVSVSFKRNDKLADSKKTKQHSATSYSVYFLCVIHNYTLLKQNVVVRSFESIINYMYTYRIKIIHIIYKFRYTNVNVNADPIALARICR